MEIEASLHGREDYFNTIGSAGYSFIHHAKLKDAKLSFVRSWIESLRPFYGATMRNDEECIWSHGMIYVNRRVWEAWDYVRLRQ